MWLIGMKKDGASIMPLRIEEGLDKALWCEYINNHPASTIFHDPDWLEILEETYPIKIQRLGVFDSGRLVGIMPLAIQRIAIFNVAGSPISRMATQYQGFLLDHESFIPETLEALNKHQKNNKIDYIQFYFPEKLPNQTFIDNKYAIEDCKTLIIDIDKTEEEILSGFERTCRGQINRARKTGIEIFEVENMEEWLDDYWPIVSELYHLQNMPPPFPKQFYINLWEKLKGKNKMSVAVAKVESKIIASRINVYHKDWAYALDGAALQKYKKQGTNNILEWYLIKMAQERGLKKYDFIGANTPRIVTYKKQFGCQLKEYTFAYRTNSSLAKLGRKTYETLSPFTRRIKKMCSI